MKQIFKSIAPAVKAVFFELRDVLRDNGVASLSRYGSAVIVAAWVYVTIKSRAIPERTELVGVLLASLYGANQLPKIAQVFANLKKRIE